MIYDQIRSMFKKFKYWLYTSYRRKNLDRLQKEHKSIYKGIVLDIGGRDRGQFKKPKKEVKQWIFVDIEANHKPDMVLDVANMNKIDSNSIDIVNAMELFEHVKKINQGLKECYRILKPNGKMLISAPFLFPVHADPFDYQRWTDEKWRLELESIGFKIEKIEITGLYFTVLCEQLKKVLNLMPKIIKYPLFFIYFLLDFLVYLDKRKFVKNHRILGKYHGGYFIIARK